MEVLKYIPLMGGLALFLYGMNLLGNGLEKLAGSKMEIILSKLTSNIFMALLLGTLVTAVIQSSSATTVIVVGLVNAGVLKLRNSIGVIMGANIGTTITGQIVRLGFIEDGGSLLLKLTNPKTLAPIIAIIGVILLFTAKRSKIKNISSIMLGFGILFTGIFNMEAAMAGIKDEPWVSQLFLSLTNPILGVLAGSGITALIQSSSASVAILQAVSQQTGILFAAAFPIIMGQNIGTCITPILSSIGANKNAKRSAGIHLSFNILGTVIFLVAIYSLKFLFNIPFIENLWITNVDAGKIANFHTLFNLLSTLLLLPFAGLLYKLVCWIIPEPKKDDEMITDCFDITVLDDRLLVSPALAISQCESVLKSMSKHAKKNVRDAIGLYSQYDYKAADKIIEREARLDKMEDALSTYLIKLTNTELSDNESQEVSKILHLVSEFEHIGDHAIDIMHSAQRINESPLCITEKGDEELKIVSQAILEIVEMVNQALIAEDLKLAKRVEALEQTIDIIAKTVKHNHIERLKNGECTVETGVMFIDMLSQISAISDHCSNIAVYILEKANTAVGLKHHEYLQLIHKGEDPDYRSAFEQYSEKYLSSLS